MVQQYLYTLGQDVINPTTNYINFYCNMVSGSSTDTVLGQASSLDSDCGRNELSTTMAGATTVAQVKGN